MAFPEPASPRAGESLAGTQISPVAGPPFPRRHLAGESRGSRRNAGRRETAPSASATGHRERRRAPPRSRRSPRAPRAHPSAESAVAPHVSGEEPCDWLGVEDGPGRRLPWTWRSPPAPGSASPPAFPPLHRSSACRVKVRNRAPPGESFRPCALEAMSPAFSRSHLRGTTKTIRSCGGGAPRALSRVKTCPSGIASTRRICGC